MIKELIKRQPLLRRLFTPLARLRARWRGVSEVPANNYQTSVVGGTMIVAPANIPG